MKKEAKLIILILATIIGVSLAEYKNAEQERNRNQETDHNREQERNREHPEVTLKLIWKQRFENIPPASEESIFYKPDEIPGDAVQRIVEAEDKLMFFEKLMSYAVPKLQATALSMDFNVLTDSQLDYMLEELKQTEDGQAAED